MNNNEATKRCDLRSSCTGSKLQVLSLQLMGICPPDGTPRRLLSVGLMCDCGAATRGSAVTWQRVALAQPAERAGRVAC